MTGAHLDTLAARPDVIPAARPANYPVGSRVHRSSRHPERAPLSPKAGHLGGGTRQAAGPVGDPRRVLRPQAAPSYGAAKGDQPPNTSRRCASELLGVPAAQAPADQTDPPSGVVVEPLEPSTQLLDDMHGRAPIGAETPARDVVAEATQDDSEQRRCGIAGEPPRQDKYGMSVTPSCSPEQWPGHDQCSQVEPGPWRLSRQENWGWGAVSGSHRCKLGHRCDNERVTRLAPAPTR